MHAALEFAEQVRAGEIPQPDVIVVGAGTCGTMAGLTAGFHLAGLDVRLIGVRCVDRIVCHSRAITRLANNVLARIGVAGGESTRTTSLSSIAPLHRGYGIPLERAEEGFCRTRFIIDSSRPPAMLETVQTRQKT